MVKKYLSIEIIGLLKFFLKKIKFLKRNFTISDFPLLDKKSLSYFCSEVNKCSSYLEYGSGGSTIYVAKKNKEILSIENDYDFHIFLKNKINAEMLNADLRYANTGIVGAYGIPIFKNINKKNIKRWKSYVEMPWKILKKKTRLNFY